MSKYLNTCIEPYLESFTESIASENYSHGTLKIYRAALRKVGHEMDLVGISTSQLTPDIAEALGRKVPQQKANTVWPYRLARRFAQHLIDIAVASPVPLTEAQQARAQLFEDFENYLVGQRGLSPRSVAHTMGFARRLLDYRFGERKIDPSRLQPSDVIEFMEHVMSSARRDKTVATHVRIFLQYLFASGVTATNLSLCLPRMAKRWAPRLPRHLAPEGVEAVLAWVRGNPRTGARDFAMLLLMARLGLRASELIAIELDDINWRTSELTVRGKGKLHDRLPITAELGEALALYLREERGPSASRKLFVAHRAPHRPFKDGQIANDLLKKALVGTGQKPVTPYVGSHLLRHSLAVQMVNNGASLDEIGDVLRHRSRASTMIYARLDVDGLRSLALPWPAAGGVQ